MMPTGPGRAAGDPPTLDTAGLCKAESSRRLGGQALDECLADERRALDYLRAAYPAVPRQVSQRCEHLSRQRTRGFGSYAFIQGCLDLK